MLSKTLFQFGPYEINSWNIIVFLIIFISASFAKKTIHKLLKEMLNQANIKVDGQKITWLRLLSQSVYLLAFYIAISSLKVNNNNITFIDFLNHNFIDSEHFNLRFYNLIAVIAIYFSARIIINLSKLYISRYFKDHPNIDEGSEYVYLQLTKYVVSIIAFFISLKALDIQIAFLLTGSAALLVGLGLGLQDVFKDMFSGIVLLFEGNLKVGDIIEISNSGTTQPIVAKILKINVRTTHIETRDGNVLIIPNNKLTQEHIENWSHGSELSRFIINLNIAYGTDTQLVSRLLKQAALSHPRVRKNMPVDVRLANFGDNGIDIELLFWADQSWDINFYKSDIRMEIDRLFREYKIVIPFPQRDIHIISKG